MGYAEDAIIMDSRAGSVSSGLGCSSGMRGQTLKSSPFYPRSSSNLTQSIIRDHMVSHYKKVYSAKAAIDTSVPKSMTHSVKYNDQIRKDRLKKGGRPQSAHSLSQSNSRASSSSAQSGLSAQYDGSPYLCSRSSMVSSPRFSTSFHAKETVYQSSKADHSHHTRPASEIKYRSPALHRKQSACSLTFFGDQNCYKTFQDPVRKTYSGDLLQKHSKHFTQDKPFTPKTLISDKNSYLAKYRYYRAPRRKPTQDCTNLKQETYYRSTKTKECTQESDEPLQGFITDHEQSEDEFNGTYFSASRQRSWVNKGEDHYLFASLSRVSPEDGKSPIMKNVSAEEEELMYLEFISAVTEDILARGHISNRVLDRVIKRHIEMNQHQLDEGKMRHLLDVLRKEFEEETNSCTSRTELEKKEDDPLNSLLSDLESGEQQVKTKKDHNLFPYASLIKDCNSPFHTDTLSVSTPLCSPESTASNEKDKESDNEEKYTGSPWLSEHVINNTEISEEDFLNSQIGTTATHAEVSYENHEHTTVACDETFHHDQGEASYTEQSKDLENLGISLSQSLHVSVNQQHENTAASVSDDEF